MTTQYCLILSYLSTILSYIILLFPTTCLANCKAYQNVILILYYSMFGRLAALKIIFGGNSK